MSEAFIVEAVRTPVGRRGGGLSQIHPADMGGHVIQALMERSKLDPEAVEDVVFGCLDQIGPQAGDIARTCALLGGLPEHVPGVTVDRQCGSSQQAVSFAAQAVMSGTMDVVVAGGVQNMSQVPITAAFTAGQADDYNPYTSASRWQTLYGSGEVSQFVGAEMMADKWDISREEMEEFAVESHRRALRAQAEGRFDNEIVPIDGATRDEGPREPDLDKIRSLPTLTPDGRITAAARLNDVPGIPATSRTFASGAPVWANPPGAATGTTAPAGPPGMPRARPPCPPNGRGAAWASATNPFASSILT